MAICSIGAGGRGGGGRGGSGHGVGLCSLGTPDQGGGGAAGGDRLCALRDPLALLHRAIAHRSERRAAAAIVGLARTPKARDAPRTRSLDKPLLESDGWPQRPASIEIVDAVAAYGLQRTPRSPPSPSAFPQAPGSASAADGCGKSSLAKVLARVVNVRSGTVRIGDVDTATIPLQRLRRNVCLVPQVMGVGEGETFRTVLDPSGCADERGLWQALTVVGLQPAVSAAEGGLDAPIARGWSAGERQLLAKDAHLRRPCDSRHRTSTTTRRSVLDTVRWETWRTPRRSSLRTGLPTSPRASASL